MTFQEGEVKTMQVNMKFMNEMKETSIDDNVIVIEVTGTNGRENT